MAKRRTTIIIEEEIGLENTKSVFVNEEKSTEVKESKAEKSTSKPKSKRAKTKSSKTKTKSTTSKTKSSSNKGTKKKTSSKKSSKKTSNTKDKEVKENTSLKQVETKENLEETPNQTKELPSPLQKETSKETKNELTIKKEDKITPSLLDKAKDNKETITDPEIIDPIKEDKDNKDKENLDVIDATIIEKDNRDGDINKEEKEEDSSKTNLPKEKEDKPTDKEKKNLPTNTEDDLDKTKEKESNETALPESEKEDKDNKESDESSKDKTSDENKVIVSETPLPQEETSSIQDEQALESQPLQNTSSQSQEKDDKQDSKKLPLSVKLNPLSLIKLFSKSKYKGVIIGTTILVILVAILVPISINLLNKDPYKEINEEDINKKTFITKDEFFNEVTSFDLKLATSKYNDVTSEGYLLSSFNKVNDIYSFSYESRFDDIAETSVKGGPIVYKTEITLDKETNKYKIDNYEDSTLVNTSSISESKAISYIKEYVNLFYDAYLIYDSEYLKGIIEEGKESNSSPKYFINQETSEIKVSSSPSDIYEFNYDQNGIIKDGIYATSIKESKDNPNSEINKIYSQLEFKYTLNS